jgi:hypothetical protein
VALVNEPEDNASKRVHVLLLRIPPGGRKEIQIHMFSNKKYKNGALAYREK